MNCRTFFPILASEGKPTNFTLRGRIPPRGLSPLTQTLDTTALQHCRCYHFVLFCVILLLFENRVVMVCSGSFRPWFCTRTLRSVIHCVCCRQKVARSFIACTMLTFHPASSTLHASFSDPHRMLRPKCGPGVARSGGGEATAGAAITAITQPSPLPFDIHHSSPQCRRSAEHTRIHVATEFSQQLPVLFP